MANSARIVDAMALPSINLAPVCSATEGLACNADRPRLANHDHLDLARILELALDLARDLVGEARRSGVVYRVGCDDNPHFPSGLDGEHLLHPLEFGRELLELGEAFDVRLERVTPGAGTR